MITCFAIKKIEGNEIWHLNFDVFKNHFRNKINNFTYKVKMLFRQQSLGKISQIYIF